MTTWAKEHERGPKVSQKVEAEGADVAIHSLAQGG